VEFLYFGVRKKALKGSDGKLLYDILQKHHLAICFSETHCLVECDAPGIVQTGVRPYLGTTTLASPQFRHANQRRPDSLLPVLRANVNPLNITHRSYRAAVHVVSCGYFDKSNGGSSIIQDEEGRLSLPLKNVGDFL